MFYKIRNVIFCITMIFNQILNFDKLKNMQEWLLDFLWESLMAHLLCQGYGKQGKAVVHFQTT